jgi:CheY-like chemotaxis protein
MNPKTLEQIFEPFFTTKKEGKGTGLGLATVYGIIKQNAGTINVYSEESNGTTFRIYLPIYRGEGAVELESGKQDLIVGGNETILLVEDEEALLHLTKTMLEKLGYKVLTALCPLVAIELAQEYKDKIDLVLSDVLMPKMNGKELTVKLHKLLPQAKVLYMSGYAAEVLKEKVDFHNEIYLMEKPFNFITISREVRKVLDN